jgi:hypothetical protein
MIFAKPPSWKWLPDYSGPRKYGAIHNEILCYEEGSTTGRERVYVVIPSALNLLLFHRYYVGAESDVYLECVKIEKRWYLRFSINGEEAIPLLYWTESNRPNWV